MTLVSAYERLIGARGEELHEVARDEMKENIKEVPATPAASPVPGDVAANPIQSDVQSDAKEQIAAETRDETTTASAP